MRLVLLPLLLLALPALAAAKIPTPAKASAVGVVETNWPTLSQLDPATGKESPLQDPLTKKNFPPLSSIDGKVVKLPGFMVPLDFKDKKVTEFLLVPSLPACIHVPPPPANQTIHVKMKAGRSAEMAAYGPIWVEGKLKVLRSKKTGFGEASYELEGESTQAYQLQGPPPAPPGPDPHLKQ